MTIRLSDYAGMTKGPWKAEPVDSEFRAPQSFDTMIIAENMLVPGIVWEFGGEGKANALAMSHAPLLISRLTAMREVLEEARGSVRAHAEQVLSECGSRNSYYKELCGRLARIDAELAQVQP